MRSLDFLCAFLDFFVCPRIAFRSPVPLWNGGLLLFAGSWGAAPGGGAAAAAKGRRNRP